jgi:ABC-2 type transport system ATP-binding protein
MTDDIAIKIDRVSKQFLLPHEKKNTIKSIFTSLTKGKSNYTKQQALKDISIEIKQGEFFGIVGRNGSGKSTLLKIIAGIYQPTKGEVTVNGRLVPFIELGVGFNAELTGRENVFLNGAILGFTRKQIGENYDKIVDFAELHEFMDQKLKNYSSGMQVRLAFACATMAEAEILLVDEVLAVGDADFQRKCFNYFRLLKKRKTTVVFVTHDMSSVREYCDRAILINDATITIEGSVNKIADEYTKLFMQTHEVAPSEDDDGKQTMNGSGKLLIKKIKAIPNIKAKADKVLISFEIQAAEEVENPVIGIKIKTSADEQIMGTNTQLENVNVGLLKKGDGKKVEFVVPNIFNNGQYNVELAALSRDGEVYDWLTEAASFNVVTEKKTGYLVEVPVTISVSNG